MRAAVHEALSDWWKGPAKTDAPVTIVGWDGVGKTWATLHWLVENKGKHPIIMIVPSSSASALSGVSESEVKRFLADRLYELTNTRDSKHWMHRLDLLFKRPIEEGPVLTVYFDGLNQDSSVPWLSLLKVLQGEAFAGRVRVIVSTRQHHFKVKLSKLSGLVVPTALVYVDIYSKVPGGELDQMLEFECLTQADLHPELVELARTPRLFKLVVQFRDRLVEAGQITVHRLLWEYGRDTSGERAGKSFSEAEWRDWLKEIAQKYRDGISEFSLKSLGETASRADLSEREIYARLSDIIDGRFAATNQAGVLQLTPTVVAHALGAALLAHLDNPAKLTFAAIHAELTQWLDPISGFDERAEILRAAVSIIVEKDDPTVSGLPGVLVTAWLQTQNTSDNQRRELASLAPQLCNALLDAVEHSGRHTHTSARIKAINALRAIPRTHRTSFETIVRRTSQWLSIVSRDFDPRPEHADYDKSRSERLKRRIGIDSSVRIKVLGIEIELVERDDGALGASIPAILEGFPLAKATPVFEVAAVAFAVSDRIDKAWKGLRWLCLLNEADPGETATTLRELSLKIRFREPENGIHPDLPTRVAALLLWLSGQESDENSATSLDPGIDRFLTYEKDYLPHPSRSLFELERRHAEITLNDTELTLVHRVQRTKELWLDPSFDPPVAFVAEIRAAVAYIDVEKLDRHRSITLEDHRFEELEHVLARCAPDLLADLVRRKMQSLATCPVKSRYWSAIRATDYLLLAGQAEADAARTLRMNGDKVDDSHEHYAASNLLMVEISGKDAQAQLDALIGADLKGILVDFKEILIPPTPEDVDALISRYSSGSVKQQRDLVYLFSVHPVQFSDTSWSWLEAAAEQGDKDTRGIIFNTLSRANAIRFGQKLAAENWSWIPQEHLWVNHYGTGALILATQALPFDQVAPRLAPWRLLEAARVRGCVPAEVRLAAEIFGQVLLADQLEAPDPGSILTLDRTKVKSAPFIFSVSPQAGQDDSEDPISALKAAMDFDAQIVAHRRAAETASSRITEARLSGASLFLTDMDAEDFVPVLQHAPDMVDHWLEGLNELSHDFQRRVRLAESAFLALCEALLASDPPRGTLLWRALRVTVRTQYTGGAEVDDLLHMVFRAPDSMEVSALRNELIGLECCNTDQELLDRAIAASYNYKACWLAAIIEADRASGLVWRCKRAEVLAGFSTNNRLPIEGAWPEGEISTNFATLRHRSARFQWVEACAHHWWKTYLESHDPVEAYAAWVLFLRSADFRSWIWMSEDIQTFDDDSAFFSLKMAHAELNRSSLKWAMKKRTKKLDEIFLNRKIYDGIGPWGKKP